MLFSRYVNKKISLVS